MTDAESVRAFAATLTELDVLVNNAGGAFGAEPVATGDPADWQAMFDVNVLGTLRVTQALLPLLQGRAGRHDRQRHVDRRVRQLRGRRPATARPSTASTR